MQKGFTLVEVLVVMGTLMVVLGFGAFGVIRLRKSLAFNSAYADLLTFLRETRNEARNSLQIELENGGTIRPDLYVVALRASSDNAFTGIAYSESETTGFEDQYERDGDFYDGGFREALRNDIQIDSINCNENEAENTLRIGFLRSSTDILSLDIESGNNLTENTQRTMCTITLGHENLAGDTRSFEIDFIENRIISQ